MAAQLDENEDRLWQRIHYPDGSGRPLALAPTVTPWPAWAMIASIAIIPVGLVMMFFARRQVVIRFADEIVVCEVGFWRQKYGVELLRFAPGEKSVSVEGSALVVDGKRFHLEPGWSEAGSRVAAG